MPECFLSSAALAQHATGAAIVLCRALADCSQAELATYMECSQATVSKWEKGVLDIRVKQLRSIAALGGLEFSVCCAAIEDGVQIMASTAAMGQPDIKLQARIPPNAWRGLATWAMSVAFQRAELLQKTQGGVG